MLFVESLNRSFKKPLSGLVEHLKCLLNKHKIDAITESALSAFIEGFFYSILQRHSQTYFLFLLFVLIFSLSFFVVSCVSRFK